MNNTHKRKKFRLSAAGRGIAAVCAAAVILTAMVFLISGGPEAEVLQLPEEEETGSTEAPGSLLPENPYGPDDFVYEGDYLVCTAGEAVPGVDVSAHQGEIDWPQVAEAGMEFAIVRLGYRGTTSGGLYADEFAEANLRGAADAGLQVGAYFFSQAITPTEAALEAAYCIRMLDGRKLDLPVVFDWEYTGDDTRTADLSPEELLACAKTFCTAMEDAGYEAMIYFNPHIAETMLDLEQLRDYPFWLAMYTDEMTFPHRVDLWQYSHTGKVPGITGDSDLNLMFTYD